MVQYTKTNFVRVLVLIALFTLIISLSPLSQADDCTNDESEMGHETCITTITIVPITVGLGEQGSPAIHGDRVVWQDFRNGYTNADIYMRDIATGQETQITNNTAHQKWPVIYGDKIAWTDERNGNYDVYMYDISTGQETQITTDPARQQVSSIYENKIAWSDYRNGQNNGDVYLYDISTGQETQITTNTEDQFYPLIYGDKIVFTDTRNRIALDSNEDIYMYDLSTGQETPITTAPYYQFLTYFDGTKITWLDSRNAGNLAIYEIYTYDLSTGQETKLPANASWGLWDSVVDGNTLVLNDYRNGNYDLYMYDLSTGKETQLDSNTEDQQDADIYGNRIVWQDWRYDGDIYMATVSSVLVTNPNITISTSSLSEELINIPYTYTVNVTNTGDEDASDVLVSLYLLDDAATYTPLSENFDSLAIGETKTATFTITSPNAGSETVTVFVDYSDKEGKYYTVEYSQNYTVTGFELLAVPENYLLVGGPKAQETIDFVAGQPQTISSTTVGLDVTLNTTQDVSNPEITLSQFSNASSITTEAPTEKVSATRFIDVSMNESFENAIQFPAELKVTYEQTEIDGNNIQDGSLKLFAWNETDWEELPSMDDTTTNTVTAQTPHFSTFGLFGNQKPATTSSPSSSSGGGGGGGSSSPSPTVVLSKEPAPTTQPDTVTPVQTSSQSSIAEEEKSDKQTSSLNAQGEDTSEPLPATGLSSLTGAAIMTTIFGGTARRAGAIIGTVLVIAVLGSLYLVIRRK